ncbi:MAG: hypothetical protein ACT4PV_15450 [Planctomycetaceae bacterium]
MTRLLPPLLFALLATAWPSAAQDTPPRGAAREAMWPAPTAEDWKKPCLITWQRTWEDALAVSRESGKSILICINMDGEIASEHYAGVRYRDPEITALYEPYVTVIASVYRHNPRDHDDEGRRIPCPRFGGVTCGEHIWIEPILFEKFCDGQRVAPRHICVDLEGKELYDVYYANDTASVFQAIREGPDKLPAPNPPIVRGDRAIVDRVESRAVEDRSAVERAYREGDAATRKALLEAAVRHSATEQLDLLRLAIFGLDVDQARLARRALAAMRTADATQLVSDALQVPMDPEERAALVATLRKLGEASPLARYLAGVHQGLAGGATALDPQAWGGERGGAEYPDVLFGGGGRESHVEERAAAAEARPTDPEVHLDLAEATLAFALKAAEVYATNPRMARMATAHMLGEARRIAKEAEALGANGWRLQTVLALAAYYGGDTEDAYARAAEAVKAIPPGDPGWSSMAVVTVFAESRWKAIKAAVRESREWPPEYLSDLHAAYTLLLRHPLGTDGQVVWHYEFLDWLGAQVRASRVLEEGIRRFPDSQALHALWRERLLRWRGPDALEASYEAMLKERAEATALHGFAGAASVAAADQHRRVRAYEKSLAAYARALGHYEAAAKLDAASRDASDEAIALLLASRARVAYELGDDEAALRDTLASFARGPGSAGTRDAMGITPVETAQMLLARLRDRGKGTEARSLETALAGIDPDFLTPDWGLTER